MSLSEIRKLSIYFSIQRFDTIEKDDHSVTIRDRDTMAQKRIKIDDLKDVLRKLVAGELTFDKLD